MPSLRTSGADTADHEQRVIDLNDPFSGPSRYYHSALGTMNFSQCPNFQCAVTEEYPQKARETHTRLLHSNQIE